MKRREGKGAADLLVCFPTRSHLSLMPPKQICSPVRPTDSTKRHHQQHQNHQLSRSSNRGSGVGGVGGSPTLWAKTKAMGSDNDEPTSPKVTCAGQIKVKSKHGSCKNWQSVMQEIERLHHHNKSYRSKNKNVKKKPTWADSLGLKKDAMQFLTCLRGFRFDFRCFGSFHGAGVISSDDDDDDDDDDDEEDQHEKEDSEVGSTVEGSSKAVFSKWFMVLQENQNNGLNKQDEEEDEEFSAPPPPPNALLLMRCRSAPAKSWLEEKEEEEQKLQKEAEEEKNKKIDKATELNGEEQNKKIISNKESLILRCYSPDFFKVSSDVAKETWVVGGMKDPLARSRSWKR